MPPAPAPTKPEPPAAPATPDAAGRAPRGRLERAFGAGVGLALGVGTTIGSGILRAPAEVAAQLPDLRFIVAVWVAGGLYALLGAISMAEAATIVGRSGGFYPIARRALGPYVAFIVGFLDFAAGGGSLAALALLIGDNAAVALPVCQGHEMVVAIGSLLGFAVLQWRGVKIGGRAQVVMSLAKALAFLALVIGCFVTAAAIGEDAAGAEAARRALRAMPTGTALAIAIAVALQGVIYTFDGWYSVVYFGEEVKNPGRDVPRSLFSTVAAVTILQLLVNFAFLAVLPISVLAASLTPAADAAAAVVGGSADRVVAALIVVALAGAMNAILLGTPRILYAMASDGVVPRSLSATRQGGTPTVALVATLVLTAVFLWSGTFERVIASLSVLLVGMYASSFLAVIVMRVREPDVVRPFRAWGYPVTTVLGLALSAAFLVAVALGDPKSAAIGAGILAASVPLYLAQRAWRARNAVGPAGR